MSDSNQHPEIQSLHRTAKRLGIASRTLLAAVRAGDLPAYRPGQRTTYLRWDEVLSWLDTMRVDSRDAQ